MIEFPNNLHWRSRRCEVEYFNLVSINFFNYLNKCLGGGEGTKLNVFIKIPHIYIADAYVVSTNMILLIYVQFIRILEARKLSQTGKHFMFVTKVLFLACYVSTFSDVFYYSDLIKGYIRSVASGYFDSNVDVTCLATCRMIRLHRTLFTDSIRLDGSRDMSVT